MSRFKSFKSYLYDKAYRPLMQLCISLFYYLPVNKRKIVLMHDFGNDYGDSPKYIAEELLKRNKGYKLVWIVNDMKMQIPKPIKKVYIARIRSVFELSTAKVFINTGKYRYNVKKKSSQFFIYVPHGQIGAKYVERQAGDNLGKSYQEGSVWHSSVSNLFISSSKLFTEEMLTYYWYNGEVQETGLPRNDIFFHHTQEDIVRIKSKLGISTETKIAFYAPTFRDSGDASAYQIDMSRLHQTLEKKTGGKWLILVRLHPNFIWFEKPAFEYGEKIKDVTSYPDIQELLVVSNILITDYSSTMFDFYLMKRPVFLFTKDIPEYKKMRGLKDWFFKVPFPFCHDNDELNEAVNHFNNDEYELKCIEFDKIYGSLESGNSTQALVNRIEAEMQ